MDHHRRTEAGVTTSSVYTEDTEHLEALVQTELVGMFIRQSREAAMMAPIGALFLAAIQFGHRPALTILGWLMLVILADGLTIVTALQFERSPRTPESMHFWRLRQTVIHIFAGLAWGSAMLLFVDVNTPIEYELQTVFVLMLVSALSVTPLSTSLPSLIGFLAGPTLLAEFHYCFGPHSGHLWIGISTLLLAAFSLHFGWAANRQSRAYVLNSVINDHLASALGEANLTINETNTRLQEKNDALTKAMQRLNKQATHDELTGLYNRRYILDRLEKQLQDVRRYHTPCSIAILDIDHFKEVNDRYGHGIGDLVLKGFADRIQHELRQGDVFARYGGEEFLLMLPMTELEDAGKLVDRLRQIVEENPIIEEPVALRLQCSFGVAEMSPSEPVHDCISRADEALYRAKQGGRNRVELAKPESRLNKLD